MPLMRRPEETQKATDPARTSAGARVRYAVAQEGVGYGYVWVRLVLICPLSADRPIVSRISGGRFYDDAPGHPEGALAWATASAVDHAGRMAGGAA
jgi:hypothetical protein